MNDGDRWERISDREKQVAVDGGDGLASVGLTSEEATMVETMSARTASDPDDDPMTGAELGMDESTALADIANAVSPGSRAL